MPKLIPTTLFPAASCLTRSQRLLMKRMTRIAARNSHRTYHDEFSDCSVEFLMKQLFLSSSPDSLPNHSKIDHHQYHSMATMPYSDPPYVGPSMAGYGLHSIIQSHMAPQMLGITPGRLALPLDTAEDGPIYVNAKQYHGILRRRQSRAKLEAQNKLVKARKPYLHESRHQHALNRVRGSGGRFLSTKKLQQSTSKPVITVNDSGSNLDTLYEKNDALVEGIHLRNDEYASSITTCSDTTTESSRSVSFTQSERRLLVNSHDMGGALPCGGGLSFSGTQHCASVVR